MNTGDRMWMAILAVLFLYGCGPTKTPKTTTPESSPSASTPASTSGDTGKKETAGATTPPKADPTPKPEVEKKQEKKEEPKYITVQHILIGFQGSLRGKPITRTKEEAKTLAEELLKKAKAGEDFDTLVKEHTDDSHPGIYKMANHGVPGDRGNGVRPRGEMVPAFGNVGFPLAVGEVGMAAYDPPRNSPFGWHIVKRVE